MYTGYLQPLMLSTVGIEITLSTCTCAAKRQFRGRIRAPPKSEYAGAIYLLPVLGCVIWRLCADGPAICCNLSLKGVIRLIAPSE